MVDLYYQRNAGYVLMGRTGDQSEAEAGNRTNWVAYDIYDLATGVRRPIESLTGTTTLSCDGGMSAFQTPNLLRYIPNPEGTVVARFSLSIGCDAREYSVSFLTSVLSQIGREYLIRDVANAQDDEAPLGSPLDLAWSLKMASLPFSTGGTSHASIKWRRGFYDPNGTGAIHTRDAF